MHALKPSIQHHSETYRDSRLFCMSHTRTDTKMSGTNIIATRRRGNASRKSVERTKETKANQLTQTETPESDPCHRLARQRREFRAKGNSSIDRHMHAYTLSYRLLSRVEFVLLDL